MEKQSINNFSDENSDLVAMSSPRDKLRSPNKHRFRQDNQRNESVSSSVEEMSDVKGSPIKSRIKNSDSSTRVGRSPEYIDDYDEEENDYSEDESIPSPNKGNSPPRSKTQNKPKKWYTEDNDDDDYSAKSSPTKKHNMKLPGPKELDDTKIPKKKSGFSQVVAKARILSPFRSKKKSEPDSTDSSTAKKKHFNDSEEDVIDRKGSRHDTSINRRQSHEPTALESPTKEEQEALSPTIDTSFGTGALSGRVGSGVLLEGWLRQKQRKGVRGMKIWNDRYFVLYAKYNEIRYYTEVAPAAWGPIPLGEIGAIPLRLIQKIATPSHPKYKGCRFDITCRSSWGTHYADDFVPSDDEDETKNSRIYSLLADSPQTRVAWVAMLDSLLKRSESPRPLERGDSLTPKNEKGGSLHRRKSSFMDTEEVIVEESGNSLPKAVSLAIDYLEASTPGIESENFYLIEPSSSKLKASLKFLNQFAKNSQTRTPDQVELEQYLDPVIAGAIVKLWLKQTDRPLIPYQLYNDFIKLADYAADNPYDLIRNLQTLIDTFPESNLKKMENLLFHLASVAEYSNVNHMDPETLGQVFGSLILKKSNSPETSTKANEEKLVVQHLIANTEGIF